jgi:dienelactone hydrolase
MRAPLRRALAWLAVAAVLFAARVAARPYVRATSLIVRSAGLEKQHPTLAALQTNTLTERKATVPTRFGELRARVYVPTIGYERTVLLTPGVNALGIDEPRLVSFARHLASTGLLVVTPELPDLSRYLVTARSTDMIEDAAAWLSGNRELGRGGPIGLMGISFAGGLSVVAAGRPSLRGRLGFVFSFGGHANFQRVLRYLCTGDEPRAPDGTASKTPAPHDYGVAILALDLADRLVPDAQREPLRAGIETFLHASHLALFDRAKAAEAFGRAAAMEAGLEEPARTILHLVNRRESEELGRRLLPHTAALGDVPALSPDQSPPPDAPVFLLHGDEDNVVPAAETLLLAEHHRRHTSVRVLLTPLISHAEVDRPATTREVIDLISFWTGMLKQ